MHFKLSSGKTVDFPNLESVHPVGKKDFSTNDLLVPCIIEVIFDGGIIEHYHSEDIEAVFF